MLYTVIPLERIYTRKIEQNLDNSNNKKGDYQDVYLQHGRIKAKRMDDHYVVERLESTDMNDYLREEYSPGSIIDLK